MAITKGKRVSASILSTAILLFGVGGWSFVADLLDYKEGTESLKWLPVEGAIKTQSIRLLNRDGGVNHFALNANYIYHIDDQAYRGDRVAYPNELMFTASQPEKTSDANKDSDASKSMFAKYAPDAPVTVFYNPSDKKQSTLTRGASVEQYLMQWLRDVALVLVAIALTVFRFRKVKQTAPPPT